MTSKSILHRVGSILLCLTIVLLLIWRFYPSTETSTTSTDTLLQTPSFVSVAKAEDTAIATTISDEAGISAWYQAQSPINLPTIRNQFRAIERETTDYIIGSVPLVDYDESQDVHLYIHKDGWLLAYYLAAEPSGKIFDWQAYENSSGTTITTKLENTIAVILGTIGIPFNGVTYYDFRYPNATHMMITAENNPGRNESFTINLPSAFSYFERSWFAANNSSVYLNDTLLETAYPAENKQGILLATELPPNALHTIRVHGGYGGLVLIYREQ